MGKINVLDKHVAELIAAGEVVERPSSAVKELVENAIDAHATAITVEIKHGGVAYIRVTDNGTGILHDDVPKAFLRHATSKVKNENDLDSIGTLGFRGEALASIGAVSKVELLTFNKEDEVGTQYKIHGGEEVLFEDAGCPQGTTIIIKELFYNIPARMKFLKRDISEANAVAGVIDKISLSHPEVAFTFIRDGKQTLKTFGDGKLLSAIYSVYGKEFANGLLPVDYSLNGITVTGYVSKPQNSRASRGMQNFFINGRFVKSRTAMAAVEEACKGSIMVGKFPSCVLQLSMPPEVVDVNVHPAKIEVRFINERPVFDAVYHAVKSALLKGDEAKKISLNPKDIIEHKKTKPFVQAENPFTAKQSPLTQLVLDETLSQKNKEEAKPKEEITQKLTPKLNIEPELFIPKSSAYKSSAYVADAEVNPFYKNQQDNENKNPKVFITQDEATKEIKDDSNKISVMPVNEELNKGVNKTAINNLTNEKEITDNYENKVINQNNLNDNKVVLENELIRESAKTFAGSCLDYNKQENDDKEINQYVLKDNLNPNVRYIGEAFLTYIVVQFGEDELMLIDKHALHERIIYERLKKEKGSGSMQYLLTPLSVTLPKDEYNIVLENKSLLEQACFEIDDFGSGTVLIRGVPQYIDQEDATAVIEEIADHLLKNKSVNTEQMDWIFHNVACRSAIKAGNINQSEELMELVNKMISDNTLRYCPHGRPVCITLTKKEIEKQFGRA